MPSHAEDERHLLRAIELAQSAREKGNHPFGALLVDVDGRVVLEDENTAVAGGDPIGHAEINLVRAASARLGPEVLAGCTLYASTEPCAMCAGAIYWSGIGRVVFALGSATLGTLFDDEARTMTLGLSCRDVFARGGRPVEVEGPLLEEQALEVHRGFW